MPKISIQCKKGACPENEELLSSVTIQMEYDYHKKYTYSEITRGIKGNQSIQTNIPMVSNTMTTIIISEEEQLVNEEEWTTVPVKNKNKQTQTSQTQNKQRPSIVSQKPARKKH